MREAPRSAPSEGEVSRGPNATVTQPRPRPQLTATAPASNSNPNPRPATPGLTEATAALELQQQLVADADENAALLLDGLTTLPRGGSLPSGNRSGRVGGGGRGAGAGAGGRAGWGGRGGRGAIVRGGSAPAA